LPKWDYDIDDWIIKALRKNKRLGRNKIYDYVDQRYREARQKGTNLSKDVFDKHLKFLVQNGIVGKNDAGQRGTRIEHFLTQEANRKLQMGTLDLIALKNQDKKRIEITPQLKFKALYILILMFNHTTSFVFQNKDELRSFLAPFHLKLLKAHKARMADDDESEEEVRKERRHFQTRVEFQDKGVTVYDDEHVNRYHGGITNVYNCQIRGMTKESVILNRIDKPFQYLSFSPDQIDKAFDLLSKDHILYPVPHSDGDYIYRIIDTDLYFLLYFLEDLFTEYVMPVMRKIWKYLRNPTSEERNWLILVEGETRANRIIIEDTEHRHEIVTTLKNKKSEKTIEIKSKVRSIQEELNGDMKTYGFIIKRYKSLQHIFEIMFPEFLQRLAVR
jgi:DNA-binding HxlR family transcriptional regulator